MKLFPCLLHSATAVPTAVIHVPHGPNVSQVLQPSQECMIRMNAPDTEKTQLEGLAFLQGHFKHAFLQSIVAAPNLFN